jgi:hypothetical protein
VVEQVDPAKTGPEHCGACGECEDCGEPAAAAAVLSDPWRVITDALNREAEGQPQTEEQETMVWQAAGLLGAATFRDAGMDMDAIEALFVDRPWSVKITYTAADDRIGIEIDWEDGEKLAVRKR